MGLLLLLKKIIEQENKYIKSQINSKIWNIIWGGIFPQGGGSELVVELRNIWKIWMDVNDEPACLYNLRTLPIPRF